MPKPRSPKALAPAAAKKPPPVPAAGPPIELEVLGTPAPKGSSQAFAFKRSDGSHGARVVPGGAKSTREKIIGWDGAVRDAALEAIGERVTPPFVATALVVEIEFRLTRPQGHYGTGKNAGTIKASAPEFPEGKPDIDKLARTTLDAMTGSIFDDDSRISRLELDKVYAAPGREGAWIRISARRARAAAPVLAIVRGGVDVGGILADLAPPAQRSRDFHEFVREEDVADHTEGCPCVYCDKVREGALLITAAERPFERTPPSDWTNGPRRDAAIASAIEKVKTAAAPILAVADNLKKIGAVEGVANVRKILAGSGVEAASMFLKTGKPGHALERHLPPQAELALPAPPVAPGPCDHVDEWGPTVVDGACVVCGRKVAP